MKRLTIIAAWLTVVIGVEEWIVNIVLCRHLALDFGLILLAFSAIAIGKGKAWGWWVITIWWAIILLSMVGVGITFFINAPWVLKNIHFTIYGPARTVAIILSLMANIFCLWVMLVDPPKRWRRNNIDYIAGS